MIRITKGLDIPITGSPKQVIAQELNTKNVALIGPDYIGLKPTMLVKEGDTVKIGQVLFTDKKNEGVLFVSPYNGKISKINRGEKRAFLSIEIELSGSQETPVESFTNFTAGKEKVQAHAIKYGLWTALRTRPFGKIPAVNAKASSIFVTAMDTSPLCADANLIIEKFKQDFEVGLEVLSQLTEGNVFVCHKPDEVNISTKSTKIKSEAFSGPHPAGLPGTHIHFLDPVHLEKQVWYIDYQDVIAFGKLFAHGKIWNRRIIALSGPRVKEPTLLEVPLGGCLNEITHGRLIGDNNRIVSGSVLSGRTSQPSMCYLGRYHTQISVLEEGNFREFLGWQGPGLNKYSTKNVFAGKFVKKLFSMTTNKNGSPRAMVPIGMFEKVMPLDILPTALLKALLSDDTDMSANLGALELEEEDMGLFNFVCPGKSDYSLKLRDILTKIERDG